MSAPIPAQVEARREQLRLSKRRSRARARGEPVPKIKAGFPPIPDGPLVTWTGQPGAVGLLDIEDDPSLPPIVRMARAYTHSALGVWITRLSSPNDMVALMAADRIINRGWGLAPQLVQVQHQQGMTREQLDAKIADALSRLNGRLIEAERLAAPQQGAEVAKDCSPPQVIEKTGD